MFRLIEFIDFPLETKRSLIDSQSSVFVILITTITERERERIFRIKRSASMRWRGVMHNADQWDYGRKSENDQRYRPRRCRRCRRYYLREFLPRNTFLPRTLFPRSTVAPTFAFQRFNSLSLTRSEIADREFNVGEKKNKKIKKGNTGSIINRRRLRGIGST